MKPEKILLVVIISCLCLSLAPVRYHKVKFVYDGDTILLEGGEKIRFLGIDAPEVDHEAGKSEFMALQAWEFSRRLLKGVQIRMEQDQEKKDRYGRLLAYLFLKNGKMVNELLVREGLAHVMFKNEGLKYRDMLLAGQRSAMKKKRGIWSRPHKETERGYLGNSNSFRFHRPDCPFGKKISKKYIIRFKTRHDAFWQGYSPCKQCKP